MVPLLLPLPASGNDPFKASILTGLTLAGKLFPLHHSRRRKFFNLQYYSCLKILFKRSLATHVVTSECGDTHHRHDRHTASWRFPSRLSFICRTLVLARPASWALCRTTNSSKKVLLLVACYTLLCILYNYLSILSTWGYHMWVTYCKCGLVYIQWIFLTPWHKLYPHLRVTFLSLYERVCVDGYQLTTFLNILSLR